jgi:hypothetical protein
LERGISMALSKEFIEKYKVRKASPDSPIFQEGPQMYTVPSGWNAKRLQKNKDGSKQEPQEQK